MISLLAPQPLRLSPNPPPVAPDSRPGGARPGTASSGSTGPAAGIAPPGSGSLGLGVHAGRAWGAGFLSCAPSSRRGLRSPAASARGAGRPGPRGPGRFPAEKRALRLPACAFRSLGRGLAGPVLVPNRPHWAPLCRE